MTVLLMLALAATPKETKGMDVYLDIASLTLRGEPPKQGWYVKGVRQDQFFIASGDLLGSGPTDGVGTPGWIELRILRFFPDPTAKAPMKPYLEVVRTSDGLLVPRRKEIVR